MTAVLEARELGKRYRRTWALADCTLSIPAGHVVGLVGPNGAGKTTLLNLAAGLLAPTAGTIEVLGGAPLDRLARVGFVAQDAPVYSGLSVADHLAFGAHLNPGWDADQARDRIRRLDLNLRQKAGTLSGGQRAQLALTLAVAKRPELLILDEPVASLDPLARREFLQDLMEAVAEQGMSVVLSSHLVADLERVCAQIAMPLWIRPHLFPPSQTTVVIGRDISFTSSTQGSFVLSTGSLPGQPGAWILSSGAVDSAGHPVSTVPSACVQAVVSQAGGPSGLDCLAGHGIRIAVTYQPASRYWAFEWTETAIYLALALALAGFCFWQLGRRRS
jgi:ABC-type nitrate/sulfonate/bicarbonate transport system ATPase subunit